MERISIPVSDMNPAVTLNLEDGIWFQGKSMMENASHFYAPILSWVENRININGEKLEITIDLSYFNSSSAKQLLKMLMVVDESLLNATVKWYYPKENDILCDRGKELEIMVDLEFEYIPK